jgi:UDP-N-acetyl-D-glucosamine dehydrogenase
MPADDWQPSLIEKIRQRNATVAVIGLGYVGLPLATALGNAGFRVIGVDLDREKVEGVNAGRSHIEDVPTEVVSRLVADGRLEASDGYAGARLADVGIIAVPTPVDEHDVPDLTALRAAAEGLSQNMRKESLVVVESTTYPDATDEIVVAGFRNRGFTPGVDISVGFSPERIDPRNATWNVTNTPKVVSGLTKGCLELTVALYSTIVQVVVPVSNIRTAEMAKLFENVFRYVNIALVNELRTVCEAFGIDVWEVIAASSTKPYGFMPFYPGPGVGGHCIPVDPYYLTWKAHQKGVRTDLMDLAGKINHEVPAHVVKKAEQLLRTRQMDLHGSRVGLLGVAYKKNTSDVRETPATRIAELLIEGGAVVSYLDPHVPVFRVGGEELSSAASLAEFLGAQDCVIVVTDHDATDWSLVLQYSPIVIDTRNAMGNLRAGPHAERARRSKETLPAKSHNLRG